MQSLNKNKYNTVLVLERVKRVASFTYSALLSTIALSSKYCILFKTYCILKFKKIVYKVLLCFN